MLRVKKKRTRCLPRAFHCLPTRLGISCDYRFFHQLQSAEIGRIRIGLSGSIIPNRHTVSGAIPILVIVYLKIKAADMTSGQSGKSIAASTM